MHYISNETPEAQRARFEAERRAFIGKLDALEASINVMRSHVSFTRDRLDLEVPEYRALLEAFYAVSEIDDVWARAQELPEYEPEPHDPRNPYGLTAGERGLVL